MKATFLIIILFSVSFAEQKAFVEDEILVKVKPGSNFVSLVESFGDELLEVLGDLNWVRVRLREGLSVDEAIKIYKNHPEIESSQPNFYYRLQAIPNDPSFTSLWGLTRISAPSAWDLTTGSSSVVVAVIDTGIRYTHEDLSSNMWRNTAEIPNNGIDDDGNGFIDD
ncbi:MAG: hypothetical protein N2Z23_09460, partial [Pyrinomonadaceae bacterium]|nr:hypothetical protein [Pyrinomonadaceae bacterium]